MSGADTSGIERARLLFAGEAGFIAAASSLASLPPARGIEIAFAGRSNVGKSSLVNALTGRKALARTSRTPGRTRELNFFRIGRAGEDFTLVDMPGYGHAAASKDKVASWTGLIYDFLRGRTDLARVYLLVDARRGLTATDDGVLQTLGGAAVSYQIVLTKADALAAPALDARRREVETRILRLPAAFPFVLTTSSRTGEGIDSLRRAIVRLLAERRG